MLFAAKDVDQFAAFGHRRRKHESRQPRVAHEVAQLLGQMRRRRIARMDLQAITRFAAHREHTALHADHVVRDSGCRRRVQARKTSRCAGCARKGRADSSIRRRPQHLLRVRSSTEGSLLITRETVFSETRERFATSLIVGLRIPGFAVIRMFRRADSAWNRPSAPARRYAVCATEAIVAVWPAMLRSPRSKKYTDSGHHHRAEHELEIVVILQMREELRNDRRRRRYP